MIAQSTTNRVKKSFPYLQGYVQRKAKRKFKTKPKLRMIKKGRVGSCEQFHNGTCRVNISRKLARENPLLAKAVIVHELGESLGVGHKKAVLLERRYLKEHGTSYRREAGRYRRTA